MPLVFVLNKDIIQTQNEWDSTFKRWQLDQKQVSIDHLRTLRKNGFRLEFKSLKLTCWMPTILNQIVHLDGKKTFSIPPIVKCFQKGGTDDYNVTFDIILEKTPPYAINRIDIDIIEELGISSTAQMYLNDLMNLADHIGCPLRLSDHAEIGEMIPCSLISLLNNERAKTYPQNKGFRGKSCITRQTRSRIAFWRIQHQDQLFHFIKTNGKVNKHRIDELCTFFQDNLPDDLKKCVLKMTLSEYVRSPPVIRRVTLFDLLA